MDYTVQVATLDGELLEEIPARGLAYVDVLDGMGASGFSLPLKHPKCTRTLLSPGEREIWVKKRDTRMWGGYLWHVEASTESPRVMFASRGWLSRCFKRHIDATKDYAQIEQLDIAWDLIDFTQSKPGGDLGITRAIVPDSGVLRDRTYFHYERKNIGQALKQLAAVENGFDFEITPAKEWRAWYPRKGKRTQHTVDLGKNIEKIAQSLDAWGMATELTGIGEGEGDDAKLSVQADQAALTRFKLLQDSIAMKDVRILTTLDAHTEEELRLRKDIMDRASSVEVKGNDPPLGSIVVGDEIRVRAKRGYIDIDEYRRVIRRTVHVSPTGNESVSYAWDNGGD